jgi:serine O-acetyltransferase
MFRAIREQFDTVFRGDPAAKSVIEIVFCYPGFHAILLHRLAHKLQGSGLTLPARMLSQLNRFLTGIEIHPGAKIGDDVLLYQGVTLGGTGKERGKRHPTIGNKVVIGTGATILGNIVIGNNAKVGAGSVVVRPVPDNSTVVGVPGRVARLRMESGEALEHGKLPDPEGQLIEDLSKRVEQLEAQLRMLAEDRLAERR